MTDAPMAEIVNRGAIARAAGRHRLDNPFYASSSMPAATGETIEVWLSKLNAWELGYLTEDLMRA